MKRKERKRDRTPLDEYTIRAYEALTQDFIYITKCQFPGDITGERVNDWMLVLEAGYKGPDGKEHKAASPRTVYNLFTNLGCFLRFCGIEPNPSSRHSYGLHKLAGTNVPGKNDPDPAAYTQEEWTKFNSPNLRPSPALPVRSLVGEGSGESDIRCRRASRLAIIDSATDG
jgi:hypothetical protein